MSVDLPRSAFAYRWATAHRPRTYLLYAFYIPSAVSGPGHKSLRQTYI